MPAAVAKSKPKKGKQDPDINPDGDWRTGYVRPFFQGKSGKLGASSGPAKMPRPPGGGYAPQFGGSIGSARDPRPFTPENPFNRGGVDSFAGRPQRLALEGVKRMKELYEARNPPPKQLKLGKGLGSQKFFSIGD